jgi:hypothetical protein
MPLIQRKGAQSSQGFGEFSAASGVNPNAYIENLFSTYLYTGTGNGTTGSQTITNNINLSANGGMVWIKARNTTTDHDLFDTSRGVYKYLISNNTDAQHTANTTNLTAFNTNGFSLGPDSTGNVNSNDNGAGSACTYASWTFRKQAKFFDVVTYTGTGSTQNISHNLGSTPSFIIVKNCSNAFNWATYHRSLGAGYTTPLNSTSAAISSSSVWNNTAPTSTQFTVGSASTTNESGSTMVAYLFAHNAGGFGLTGTDNVISCGGGVSDNSALASVNLGYEPQFVLFKDATNASNWNIADNMRGMTVNFVNQPTLYPNLSSAEDAGFQMQINSTGFNTYTATSSANYIYIAIRRGPMATPTDATKVFIPVTATLSSAANTVTTNFPVDLAIPFYRQGFYANWFDRLRGDSKSSGVRLRSASTAAEVITPAGLGFDNNTGYVDNYDYSYASPTGNYVYWNFRRAPGFFDEVCYTGTGSARSINHNLGVLPELMILKSRTSTYDWLVAANMTSTTYKELYLDTNQACVTGTDIAYTNGAASITVAPTSTTFGVGPYSIINGTGDNYVAYLFATCAGVSKVGSYTGNGTTQTINCGFTGGARFVMIKRTDATSNWFTYDTARGMSTVTDPYLPMNAVTEVATLGSVTTVSTGFALNSAILAAINVSGGSYTYLAIA